MKRTFTAGSDLRVSGPGGSFGTRSKLSWDYRTVKIISIDMLRPSWLRIKIWRDDDSLEGHFSIKGHGDNEADRAMILKMFEGQKDFIGKSAQDFIDAKFSF